MQHMIRGSLFPFFGRADHGADQRAEDAKSTACKNGRRVLYAILLVLCSWAETLQAGDALSALHRAERYLNDITTMQARFTQIAPDGSLAEGTLYLKRPGRMRWEYDEPTPLLMIARDDTLIYYDKDLDEVSYLSLDDTLAGFLARPHIDFADDALRVVNLREGAGSLRFTLLQTDRPDDGSLTLVLRTEPLRLHQLVVTDATGQPTEITLNDIRYGMKLDDMLFEFRRSIFERR